MGLHKMVNGVRVELSAEEEAEVRARWAAEEAKEAAKIAAEGYKEARREAYKSAEEYLDMIWHAIDSGATLDKTSEFYTDRKAVKDTYPKPRA